MISPAPERILVRGVNWLGDAVMSTPALQRLREAYPRARITLLTPEKLRDLWNNHPAIDAVETFASDESVWRIGRRLRGGNFDTALVLPNSPRSALEIWLAGISRRVGYSRPWRNLFLTQRVESRAEAEPMRKRSVEEINRLINGAAESKPPTSPEAHHIYQYLHLAAALGANPKAVAPVLAAPPEAIERFVTRFDLRQEGRSGTPTLWLGLNPGAEYGPAKRWPEDRFAEAAIQIQRRTGCRWMIFGLKNDAPAAARITAHLQTTAEQQFGTEGAPYVINLAGATSLAELCAALKLCRVVVTNDSGPMHLAAALGTPVVVPFGSTSSELTGPGLPGDHRHHCLRAMVPCAPCYLRTCPIDFRCMLGISASQVVEAVLRALKVS